MRKGKRGRRPASSSASWDAYDPHQWPAWYPIDVDVFVRYRHFGEGAYEETEARIQSLLAERDEISGP